MAATNKLPNFLIIVADDLGFSDCSCYGSEIQTPNIDAIAEEGARFTSFHVAAACSPTRSMLLTGTDHHIAGLGQLAEFVRSSRAHQGKPGHEGYLNDRIVALPEILRDGGYDTIMSGKWHLGLRKEHHPFSKGFNKSFALLPGCSNHYGFEPQYDDPVAEPLKFFESATRALHVENSEYVSKLPDDFYSSDVYASKLIEYLDGRNDPDSPFFAYLPFSAPHWPLQAPEECVRKYRGRYEAGPEQLRQERLKKLKEMGLVAKNVQPHSIVSTSIDAKRWEELDEETRAKSSRAMEVYAGMVERMDWNIGRVLGHLKKFGDYENTLIMFMSDNGAEGASYEARPIIGRDIVAHIAKYYDNSLENIGRGNSFVWYGPYWAQAATAPSRLYKMNSTEGGCRVPLIVRMPKSNTACSKITSAFCTVMDIVPTILELAGMEYPQSEYKGRKIVPLRGTSWVPFLRSLFTESKDSSLTELGDHTVHGEDYAVGFEIAGSGSLIRGNWKITFVPKPRGPQRWELFNLAKDPGETTDLREFRPEIFSQMIRLWEEYKAEVGVVGLAGDYPAVYPGEKLADDAFEDPYAWIKYMGRKETAPEDMRSRIPF